MTWLKANSEKNARIPKPVRIPRPDDESEKPKRLSLREFARNLTRR